MASGDLPHQVRQAAGPTRDAIQWQKFEDTSTGYWLSYAPFTILYVNVGRWVHDFVCHKNGAHKAEGGGLYRPPCNLTLFVHNLKHGGFHYASHAMGQGATLYDHEQCARDGGTRIRRRGRLSSNHEEVFKSRGGLGRKRPRLEAASLPASAAEATTPLAEGGSGRGRGRGRRRTGADWARRNTHKSAT